MVDRTSTYSSRQYPLVAVLEFDFSTFTVDVVDQVFALPADAIITDVILQVKTAWDDTTPVFNVGRFSTTPLDPDDFLDGVALDGADETFQVSLSSADEEAALDNADVNHVAEEDEIAVLYTNSSGTPTVGEATLIVKYLVAGRSNENQG